jgi:hypothetical protein
MNQDVRDLIGKALQDEPAIRIDKRSVMASSRRRQRRRPAVVAGASMVSVAAILSAVMIVNDRLTTDPVISPTLEGPPPGIACEKVPTPGLLWADHAVPDSKAPTTEAAIAQAGRLTAAFKDFTFPAPAGFQVPPITFCAYGASWYAEVLLTSADRDVALFVTVEPGGVKRAEGCDSNSSCRTESTPDGAMLRFLSYQQPSPVVPLLTSVAAWRPDGTTVYVTEQGPEPGPRLLDDAALVAIATAPQLGLAGDWSVLPKPSDSRARELSQLIAAANVLPPGMQAVKAPDARVEALEFDFGDDRYTLDADLVDSAGEGNLRIELILPPPGASSVDSLYCGTVEGCQYITLPNGRRAMTERYSEEQAQDKNLTLNAFTAEGVLLQITSRNVSNRARNYGNGEPSRPDLPLELDNLVRIATLPGLHW